MSRIWITGKEGFRERAMGTPESVSKYDPHTTSIRNFSRAVRADPYMFLGPAVCTDPLKGF